MASYIMHSEKFDRIDAVEKLPLLEEL